MTAPRPAPAAPPDDGERILAFVAGLRSRLLVGDLLRRGLWGLLGGGVVGLPMRIVPSPGGVVAVSLGGLSSIEREMARST